MDDDLINLGAVNIGFGLDQEQQFVVMIVTTSDGKTAQIKVSGEGLERLGKNIEGFLNKFPEARTWKSLPRH